MKHSGKKCDEALTKLKGQTHDMGIICCLCVLKNIFQIDFCETFMYREFNLWLLQLFPVCHLIFDMFMV